MQLSIVSIVAITVFAVPAPQTVNVNGLQMFGSQAPKVCPPDQLQAVTELDLTRYISDKWYVLYQEVNTYQPAESLYCVTALYSLHDGGTDGLAQKMWSWMKGVFKFFRYGPTILELDVENFSRNGSVNSNVTNTANLRAVVLDEEKHPGNLLVGPKFVPRWSYGAYNIMAVDPDYSWAIISGGLPYNKNETTGYCQTGSNNKTFNIFTNNGNGQGLWFFSRTPLAPQQTVDTMFKLAKNLGYETGRMVKVQQEGC